MDERVVLVREDRPERPGDRHARREVALRGGEGVGCCCGFEEEPVMGARAYVRSEVWKKRDNGGGGKGDDVQSEEDKDVGPDSGRFDRGVSPERLEGGQDHEDGRPAMVEREREVDEDLVGRVLGLVVLLYDVVDVLCTQPALAHADRKGGAFETRRGIS